MNFEDEHYVRIYTRDTKTWKRWTWEARCLFTLLWRKLDKAGLMEDIEDPAEDVALMTDLPVEVVEVGLPQLIKSGTIRIVNGYLIGVNYIDGQTAKKSDKVRAKESRERRAGLALLSQIVTERHETDDGVTPCDASERDVTSRDSVTIRDGADTNRDPPSQSVTERHDNPSPRHSTQSNAEQRNAMQGESAHPRDPIELPPDWDPGAAVLDATPAAGRHTDTLARFVAYHAGSGAKRTLAQWRQAYRKWAVQDAQEARGRPPRSAPKRRQPDDPRVNVDDWGEVVSGRGS